MDGKTYFETRYIERLKLLDKDLWEEEKKIPLHPNKEHIDIFVIFIKKKMDNFCNNTKMHLTQMRPLRLEDLPKVGPEFIYEHITGPFSRLCFKRMYLKEETNGHSSGKM